MFNQLTLTEQDSSRGCQVRELGGYGGHSMGHLPEVGPFLYYVWYGSFQKCAFMLEPVFIQLCYNISFEWLPVGHATV